MPNIFTRLSEWTNARRKLVWLMLLVLVIVIVVMVLTPVFLIMPFKAQTPRTMEVSYFMRRWSPWATVLGSLAILTLTIGLWLGGRWWSRAFLVLLLLPVFGATWLARQNHFEWMFHPLEEPRFVEAWRADVDPCDMVLAVVVDGEARGYPVRLLANHHVVNDVIAGRPITATY